VPHNLGHTRLEGFNPVLKDTAQYHNAILLELGNHVVSNVHVSFPSTSCFCPDRIPRPPSKASVTDLRFPALIKPKSALVVDEGPSYNWREINKHYAFDGDWFAAEYLFQAEDKKTGQLQREGTLFFGRVKDDRLIVAIEYFDRLVKGLQHAAALPPFREDEMPFPWPDYDGVTRKYRP
jgi:hypothetical protein